MEKDHNKDIEKLFDSLEPDEKKAIITHGMTFYISSLKKRLFLANAKMREFEEKYNTSLAEMDLKGLPDDANFEIHEDYVMWHHWTDLGNRLQKKIQSFKGTEMIELYPSGVFSVSE